MHSLGLLSRVSAFFQRSFALKVYQECFGWHRRVRKQFFGHAVLAQFA